jgi:hypothetical protein
MQMKITSLSIITLLGAMLIHGTSTTASAQGQQRLLSMRAAEEAARRALAESVTGLSMKSTAEVTDMIAGRFRIDSDVAARIRGVQFTERSYDAARDIARVTASIDVGEVENILGETINFGSRTFSRVGFGTSTPESAPMLQALRAAELDAYRQLAEYFGGLEVEGKTSVRDYVLLSDNVKARFAAAIYGANMPKEDPYGFEDGTAYMNLYLIVGDVQTMMGERIIYDDHMKQVTGWGAARAERTQAAPAPAREPDVEHRRTVSTHAPVQQVDLGAGFDAPRVTREETPRPQPTQQRVPQRPYGGVYSE